MITSWYDLPIGKFKEIHSVIESNIDEDDKILRVAAICADITYEEILNLPMTETEELIKGVAFMYTPLKERKVKKEYIINGKKYIPLLNYEDMTTAQYIDFQAISQVCQHMLGEFLAIFLVPEGYKYNDGYKSSDVAKDIYDYMSCEEALALANFFIKKYSKSIKRTLLYLEAEMVAMRVMTRNKEEKEIARQAEKEIHKVRKALTSMFG